MIGSMLSLTRRNHALEHATMQILSRKQPGRRMAGYSTPRGFWVIGSVEITTLQEAVDEAQMRLRGGERQLAIHPFCGTNFALAGLAAGVVSWLAMLGGDGSLRSKWDRLPLVTVLATLAMMLTFPLGPKLQERFTTDATLGDLHVVQINRYERSGMPAHHVLTRDTREG